MPGFYQRALPLLGATTVDEIAGVCNLCAGYAKCRNVPAEWESYGPKAFGCTIDIRPECQPWVCCDVRDIARRIKPGHYAAAIVDPPYSRGRAGLYYGTEGCMPSTRRALLAARHVTKVGGRIGILHRYVPEACKGLRRLRGERSAYFIVSGLVRMRGGDANDPRWFTVFEKVG